MEIKHLTEEQYIDSMKLSMYAFQYKIKDEDIEGRKERLKYHRILGIYEEEQLAAKLHIIPLEIMVSTKKWKMGGIAGVATFPEYRRKGYVKALITEALKQMKEEGEIVSLLHPFDISFYRNYGWEIFTDNKKITIENKDLQFHGNPGGYVKRYDKETHHKEIEEVYDKYASQFSGMLVRETEWWKLSVYHDSQMAVYYNENHEATGYLLFNVSDRKMDVQEIAALNQEAREGLWNFICQHDSMVDQVSILVSVHEHFPYFIHQPKQKSEVYPYFMARIVDAEACLKKYSFSHTDEQIFLHIDDSYAPWNNGSYLIGNEEIKVYKNKPGSTCAQPPQRGIKLNINALTAMLFGYKRPADLYSMGYLQGSQSEVNVLEKMISPVKPFFYDFF